MKCLKTSLRSTCDKKAGNRLFLGAALAMVTRCFCRNRGILNIFTLYNLYKKDAMKILNFVCSDVLTIDNEYGIIIIEREVISMNTALKQEIIISMIIKGFNLGRHNIDWYVKNFTLAELKEVQKIFEKTIDK